MGLMDDIRAEQDAKRVLKCPVARLIAELPDKDSDDLRAALDDDSISNVAIARALERRGHNVRADAIGNHKTRRCACPR